MSGESEHEPTTHDGEEAILADVGIHDIGQRLIDLGEQLIEIGRHTDSSTLRSRIREADEIGVDEAWEIVGRDMDAAVRRTLAGLGNFRKDYATWERLSVEYALNRRGFTQREVAQLLGVGLSTVNRWSQSPVTYNPE